MTGPLKMNTNAEQSLGIYFQQTSHILQPQSQTDQWSCCSRGRPSLHYGVCCLRHSLRDLHESEAPCIELKLRQLGQSRARQELVQVRPQCPRRQYQPGQGMVPSLQIRRLTVIIINGTAQRTSSVCLVLVRQQCKLSRQTMDPIQLDVKLQFCAGLAQSPGPNPQLTPDACAAEQGRSMPTLHCWTRPVTLHRLQPLASDGASSDMRHSVDRTNR